MPYYGRGSTAIERADNHALEGSQGGKPGRYTGEGGGLMSGWCVVTRALDVAKRISPSDPTEGPLCEDKGNADYHMQYLWVSRGPMSGYNMTRALQESVVPLFLNYFASFVKLFQEPFFLHSTQ